VKYIGLLTIQKASYFGEVQILKYLTDLKLKVHEGKVFYLDVLTALSKKALNIKNTDEQYPKLSIYTNLS
jgi:hypothetical protein